MTLEGGDALTGTGLAGALSEARRKMYGKEYSVKKDAPYVNVEAEAIIEYLKANLMEFIAENAVVVLDELPEGTVLPIPGKGHIE